MVNFQHCSSALIFRRVSIPSPEGRQILLINEFSKGWVLMISGQNDGVSASWRNEADSSTTAG